MSADSNPTLAFVSFLPIRNMNTHNITIGTPIEINVELEVDNEVESAVIAARENCIGNT